MDKIIRDFLLDFKTGLFSDGKILKKIRKLHPSVKVADIKRVRAEIEDLAVNTAPKPKPFRKIVAPHVRANYQSDLLDMSTFAGVNGGINWILTCVDVYSRRAWAIPMKRKSGEMTAEALNKVFKDGVCKNLTTDNGKEYLNSSVKKLLDKEGVKHWLNEPGTHTHMGIVERFNRTIRGLIRSVRSIRKNNQYVDVLKVLIDNYNTTEHRGIKAVPMEVWNGAPKVGKEFGKPTDDFDIGSFVRLRKVHKTFDKRSDKEKVSRDVFEVISKDRNRYTVKNVRTDTERNVSERLMVVVAFDPDAVERGSDEAEKDAEVVRADKRLTRRVRKEGVDLDKEELEPRPVRARRVRKVVDRGFFVTDG